MRAGGSSVAAVALVATAVVAAGCCPPRRYPARFLDDPIVLPRRLVDVDTRVDLPLRPGAERARWNQGSGVWSNGRDYAHWPVFGYGLTDRVSLVGMTAVEIAILDDAPVESAATGWCAATAPLGLAVSAGVRGLGYDPSSERARFAPFAAVHLRRHLGRDLRLDGRVDAGLYRSAERTLFGIDATTAPWVHGDLGVTAQLPRGLAAGVTLYDAVEWLPGAVQFPGSADPGRRGPGWTREAVGAVPALFYRPRYWVTLSAEVDVSVALRSNLVVWPRPDSPVSSTVILADSWLQVWTHVGARLHW